MLRLTKSKNGSLFLVFIYYISSFYLAYLLIKNIDLNGWLLILAWHIFATLIIFMFSNIHKNSSIYDPFWHVAPIPIVFYTADQSTLPVMELYLVLYYGHDNPEKVLLKIHPRLLSPLYSNPI